MLCLYGDALSLLITIVLSVISQLAESSIQSRTRWPYLRHYCKIFHQLYACIIWKPARCMPFTWLYPVMTFFCHTIALCWSTKDSPIKHQLNYDALQHDNSLIYMDLKRLSHIVEPWTAFSIFKINILFQENTPIYQTYNV